MSSLPFPKQRTEVPPYYLHEGAKVTRFAVDDAHVPNPLFYNHIWVLNSAGALVCRFPRVRLPLPPLPTLHPNLDIVLSF